MISLQITEGGVKFVFTNSDHYLYGNGTIEVPLNSLALVTDESDMFTFKKAATNDPFISAKYSDIGMTKEELETFYNENMVGGGSVDPEEVQALIDASISGNVKSVKSYSIHSTSGDSIGLLVRNVDGSSAYTNVFTTRNGSKLRCTGNVDELHLEESFVSGIVTSAIYDSSGKTIELKNESGVTVSTIDATDFIKDGMLDSASVEDVVISGETVQCLVLTFNTESGKEPINIPLSELSLPIDSALSANSPNAVANSAITNAINAKADKGVFTAITKTSLNGHPAAKFNKDAGGFELLWYSRINGTDILNTGNTPNNDFSLVEESAFTAFSASTEAALSGKIDTSAITSSLTYDSTDSEVPSARIVHEELEKKQDVLSFIDPKLLVAVEYKLVIDDFTNGTTASMGALYNGCLLIKTNPIFSENFGDLNISIEADEINDGHITFFYDGFGMGFSCNFELFYKNGKEYFKNLMIPSREFNFGDTLLIDLRDLNGEGLQLTNGILFTVENYLDEPLLSSLEIYCGVGQAVVSFDEWKKNVDDNMTDWDAKEEVISRTFYQLEDEISGLTDALSGKQDTLIAGSGISISGNVISANGGGGGLDEDFLQANANALYELKQGLKSTDDNLAANYYNKTASDGRYASNASIKKAYYDKAYVDDKLLAISASLNELNDDKQETLVAGDGISISGNVISAEGGGGAEYSAGTNIEITTANTINCTIPISGNDYNSISILNNTLSKYSRNCTYIGENNTSNENATIYNNNVKVLGSNNNASRFNDDTIIIGKSNVVSSVSGGVIIGSDNNVNSIIGFSRGARYHFGKNLKTSNHDELALAKFNSTVHDETESGNTAFSVGNGLDASNRHNALELRQNGDLYYVDTYDTTTQNYYEKPMLKLQDVIKDLTDRIAALETQLNNN